MGVVYQAYDTRLGRHVAIKVLRREHLGIDGYLRLVQEAQTIAKINHPNIITIYDAGEFDGIPYMVIELLNGEALTAHVPKPIHEVFRILQICDDETSTVSVSCPIPETGKCDAPADGNIKLMDFSLARENCSRHT
jgi:serine/threonine-protein kinase